MDKKNLYYFAPGGPSWLCSVEEATEELIKVRCISSFGHIVVANDADDAHDKWVEHINGNGKLKKLTLKDGSTIDCI